MAYVERTDEEIIAAFERNIEKYKSYDLLFMRIDNVWLTARETIGALRRGDSVVTEIVTNFFRNFAKKYDTDPVDYLMNGLKK